MEIVWVLLLTVCSHTGCISQEVLQEKNAFKWNPGKRIFLGLKEELFSNDDKKMLEIVEKGL